MSLNFGGKSEESKGSTTIVQSPTLTPDQKELARLNMELAKRQIASLDQADAQAAERSASPLGQQQKQLEQLVTQNLMDRVSGKSPVLSPEAQQRLDTAFGAAQSQGEESLMKYANDLAASRGMTASDSPIGNEALRQRRLFGTQLAGQKAASSLDVGNTEANFNAALAQFQSQLQQQAFANRLAIAGIQPASYGLQNQLFSQGLASAPRTISGNNSMFGSNWSAGLSGSDVGSGLQGAGSMAALFL